MLFRLLRPAELLSFGLQGSSWDITLLKHSNLYKPQNILIILITPTTITTLIGSYVGAAVWCAEFDCLYLLWDNNLMQNLSKGLLVLSIHLLTALYWNDLSRQEPLINRRIPTHPHIYDKCLLHGNCEVSMPIFKFNISTSLLTEWTKKCD